MTAHGTTAHLREWVVCYALAYDGREHGMAKTIVETVERPFTKATYAVYATVCDIDENGDWANESWASEVEERRFESEREAINYIDSWTDKMAEELAERNGCSCVQLNCDKDFWIDDAIEGCTPCAFGAFWINGSYNFYYDTHNAHSKKPE